MTVILILLLSLIPAMPSHADEDIHTMIAITIRNDAISPLRIQVRDDFCATQVGDECEFARFLANGTDCQQPSPPEECIRAQETVMGSSCIEGLLYDGMLEEGDSVEVDACPGGAGYARISVRAPDRNAPWHSYLLLGDGETIKYP